MSKTPITAELLARLAVHLTDAETRIKESEAMWTDVRSILLRLADEQVKLTAACDDEVQVTCLDPDCGVVYGQRRIAGTLWPPTCCGACGSRNVQID